MPVRTRKIAKSDKRLISIVIPLYNEVESLPELYSKIKEVVRANRYNYEIIFVDDGSTDGSLAILNPVVNQLMGLTESIILLLSIFSTSSDFSNCVLPGNKKFGFNHLKLKILTS